jgi:zinc transport system substrate-binding protein
MHERITLTNAVLIFFCGIVLAFSGCSPESESDLGNEPSGPSGKVAVTNYPLFCFVEEICRTYDTVNEVIYVGPAAGQDAHAWVPSATQIRELQKVDLIVCNGPGAVFANWMDKVTIDESKLCETTDAMKLAEFVVVKDFQLVHSHGPEGEHSHSWVVPQSWLAPNIARKQAKHIHKKLVEAYGASRQLDGGFADLQKKFDDLESKHEKLKAKSIDLIVASSTPDVQYLTRSLGWKDRYLHWNEPRSEEQAEKELSEMRARYKEDGATDSTEERIFLWSGGALKGLSGVASQQWSKVVVVDLIDSPTASGDNYFDRMSQNLDRLGAAIE